MINQYIHVFVQLVASRRALGHGVGYSHVGCHVELVKIARTTLERVVNHVVGSLFVNRHFSDELTLALVYLSP